MILSEEQINFFSKKINTPYGQLIVNINNPELYEWFKSSNQINKGFVGEGFEWILTGKKGDKIAKPDFNGWEIKTVAFNESGTKAIEKMSLTAVNYSTIENETFETSHVFSKSKIFIVKLTKNKNPLDRKFLGFGLIDLTKYSQVQKEYEYYKNLISEGKVNLFTSKANILSNNQILHIRTAGTRKYREYFNKKGIKYMAKPYNFTLDYKVINKITEHIL